VFNFDLECGSHLAGKFREEGLAGLRLAPDCSLSAPAQRPTRSQLQTAKSSVSRIHLSIPQAKRLGSGGTQSEQWHICVKFWGPIYFETAARPSNTRTRPSATHQGISFRRIRKRCARSLPTTPTSIRHGIVFVSVRSSLSSARTP
jgi:hypothetical protein